VLYSMFLLVIYFIIHSGAYVNPNLPFHFCNYIFICNNLIIFFYIEAYISCRLELYLFVRFEFEFKTKFSRKKIIFSDMNGFRDCHIEEISQKDKENYHTILLIHGF